MQIKCSKCDTTKEAKEAKNDVKLPIGWKRINDNVICSTCLRKYYMLRAISVPIAYPVGSTKDEMWKAVRSAWRMATEVSNWAVTEMAKIDVVRTAADEKIPKFPGVYLYPGARLRCPDMTPQSVSALLRAVEQKYRRRRYDVIWTASASLPRYRYPAPYPVHNQAWKLYRDEKGYYEIRLRIGGDSWVFRLAGGGGFWRQQRQMDHIIAGRAIKGEMSLMQFKHDGHPSKIMAKMVAWIPKEERHICQRDEGKVLQLYTRDDCFWDAIYPAQHTTWQINADHVRTWIIGHMRMNARILQDSRVTSRKWKLKELERRATKQHNRIRSFCQMSCSAVVKLALSCRATTVNYDDSERDYMSSFPWAELRQMLANKLDEYGIALKITASGKEDGNSPDPLADEEASDE